MTLSDQEFHNEYKPLQIPSGYFPDDTQENKIIYALAELGEGTTAEVTSKLEELEIGNEHADFAVITNNVLTHLYDKGLLNGRDKDGEIHYNLSKITQANDGKVDPPPSVV
jgi:hypothetical protein